MHRVRGLTSVGLWQSIWISICAMNGESLHALDTLQIHESTKWYPRGTSSKTKNLSSLFSIEGLQGSPPPHYHRVRACVATILSSRAPFVHIDIRSAGDEQFKLLLVELERCVSMHNIVGHETHLQW